MTKPLRRRSSVFTNTTDGEANLQHYLTKLALPSGLRSHVRSIHASLESRIWVLDNSTEMQRMDGCLMVMDDDMTCIKEEEKKETRWNEQIQCAEFHRKMSARCWIPTKFWMTNKPTNEPQRFGICWGSSSASWTSERDQAAQFLKDLSPEYKANPLAREINKITQRLASEAERLRREGKFVSVVVCTQGVPTDENGVNSPEVMRECIASLFALTDLPVKIVFRLCTSDRDVIEFYNKIDLEIECDVLGDYFSEAKEVHQHNPWLTYGIGLHRIREAGLANDMLDYLDERPFTLDEIYDWCMKTFVGNAFLSMRDPTEDWYGFVSDLQVFLMDESLIFNPIKNAMTPWIDVEALNRIYAPHTNVKARPNILRKSSLDEKCMRRSTSFNEMAEAKATAKTRRLSSYQEPGNDSLEKTYGRANSSSLEEKKRSIDRRRGQILTDSDPSFSSDDARMNTRKHSGSARRVSLSFEQPDARINTRCKQFGPV